MTCAGCGGTNPPGKKFCGDCGWPLEHRCPQCNAESPAGKKFCGDCGAPLAALPPGPSSGPPADTTARKVVTIVFADLAGSTALHERLDAESARRLMERYYDALRTAVAAHRGTVVKLLGDGVMAAFGLRQVAEDDALRAVRAGVAMQGAFHALVREQAAVLGAVGLRVAVNTGEVVVSGAHDDLIGDPVNIAARLQEQAGDGDVVVGESTRRLVASQVTLAPLGAISLKGRAGSVAAYRLVSLDPPAATTAAPFVGRTDELARLGHVYDAAVTAPATRLALLLGSPGLGKSRLIDEISRRHAGGATILRAHCDAAGAATFAPIALAIRTFLDLDDGTSGDAARTAIAAAMATTTEESERARVAGGVAALLDDAPTSPEETFFAVRRFLAALGAAQPVVLIIDDLHWAEPLLLDLIEHLVQWGAGVPLFVLAGARPELRQLRSSFVTSGGLVSDVVTLGGLDAGAAMRLAANVIGAADLPAAVAAKVLATSEGNPLFVGELVRMLVQEGALARDGDRWVVGAGLASLEMPPTIHALLAARIERLDPDERAVLERAAVVGRHFSRSAVAALLGRNGTELDARLESLRRNELIEGDTGWFLGESVLRFHHVLIRDAAYRRLLKGTRAELHERLADWIEHQVGDAAEHDETIGWHLEQAYRHLRELGPVGDHGTTLGERAAKRLATAGRRALARDDVRLAAGVLGRALACLGEDDAARADLALDWCEALLAAGDVDPSVTALAEIDRFADDSPRLRAWHTCFAGQLAVLTAPEELHAVAERVAVAARELSAQGDAAGEAKAHFVHSQALARLGKVGACEAALDQALAAARRAGDRRRANAVLAGAPLAALSGPSPVTRASGRCLDVVRVLRITQGAPAVEAVALSCQGVLEALRGRTAAGRRMLAASRAMVEELGITQRLFEVDVFIGRVDLLEGDAAAAERALRPAYEGFRALGLGIDAARAAALLARALLALGRSTEAETLSHESEALAGDDLQAAIAWRGVRAEAVAARGEHAAAVELATAAVGIAAATDALLDHADARVALAGALAGVGRDAAPERRRAAELWEAKGATLLVERMRGGAATRSDLVDPEREAEAPSDAAPARPRRRVHASAATRAVERFAATIAARDGGQLRQLFTDDLQIVHHPTGVTYGRREMLGTWQSIFKAERLGYRHEILASLGERLALSRHVISLEGLAEKHLASFGSTEVDEVGVFEVDHQGRVEAIEIFAADRIGNALARLYERHVANVPAGAARTRAAAIARSVAVWNGPVGADGIGPTLAPTFEAVDHRSLATWSAPTPGEWLTHWRAQADLTEGLFLREEDVLALEPPALLTRRTFFGNGRSGVGDFENTVLGLTVYGPDGRITRMEAFEPDREAEALARFDELTAPLAGRTPFANAASRVADRLTETWLARDWDTHGQLFATGFRHLDRRRMVQLEFDRAQWLEFTRRVGDRATTQDVCENIATRGDRLLLVRQRIEVTDGDDGTVGASEIASLILTEIDAAGLVVRVVRWDEDDLEAAHAELDARHEAGEGAAHPAHAAVMRAFAGAVASRDWTPVIALCTPAFVEHDHRRLAVLGTTTGAEAWARNFSTLTDLAPDTIYRSDHFRSVARGFLSVGTWVGSRDGGRYEIPLVAVLETDAQDRLVRADIYDLDQHEPAQTRFAELAPPECFANAATATVEPVIASLIAHDWERFTQLFADDFRMSDRRRVVQLEMDRAQYVAFTREIADGRAIRATSQVIATRGERLALTRSVFEFTDADVGPSEIAFLILTEVDARGRIVAHVRWDLDEVDAARAELDARFAALYPDPLRIPPNGATRVNDRLWDSATAKEWETLRALLAPDFVFDDRRRGLRTTTDGDAYIAGLRWGTPNTDVRRTRVATAGDRLALMHNRFSRTEEVLVFEIETLAVHEIDAQGRFAAVVLFEADDRRAAFAELGERYLRGTRPAVVPQWLASHGAGRGLASIRSTFPDDFFFHDHRRTGLGCLETADAYVASVIALYELSPDATVGQPLHFLADEPHGTLSIAHSFGTLVDGGTFESVYAMICLYREDCLAGVELFELDDLERARARFRDLHHHAMTRRA